MPNHVIILGTALAVAALLAFAGVSDGADWFKLTKEGDGYVELNQSGSTLTLTLTPAEGGEILSFTVDGVDRVGELKPVGDGYEYVLPPSAVESAVHVVFSGPEPTTRLSHVLLVFVGAGAVAAAALFLVRRH